MGISLSSLARELGRAKSGLHKLAKRGQIPQNSDGTFDIDAVKRALVANLSPLRRKPLPSERVAVAGEQDDDVLIDERFVGAAWRSQGTEGRDEQWREHWSDFAAHHAPAIAAEFGINASALRHTLLLHVYSHIAAILPGYRDPLSNEPWQWEAE